MSLPYYSLNNGCRSSHLLKVCQGLLSGLVVTWPFNPHGDNHLTVYKVTKVRINILK